MASIDVYNIDSTSFSVRLIGLQTSADGVNYTRQCVWSVLNSSGTLVQAGTSYIAQGLNTEGGDYTFNSGISPNTTYYVICSVYRTDTNQQIATLTSSNFTTTSGGGGTTSWYVTEENLGTIDSQTAAINIEKPLAISQNQLCCFKMQFAYSGSVSFSTTGSYDTIGYLGTSSTPDLENGCPADYDYYNDNSGDVNNFLISCNVTAGTTYYLWVKNIYATSAQPTLIIKRSWVLSRGNTIKITSTNGEIALSTTNFNRVLRAYKYDLNFDTAGTARIYTTGATVAFRGYYSQVDDFDFTNGVPTNITTSSTQNGLNFSMSVDVTANSSSSNILYVRAVDGRNTGSVTIHIVPPKSDYIDKWDWEASNGSANATVTSAAYDAVLYKKSTKNFSHLVWNDMVDKVKAICDEAVGWWDSASYGLSYANTKAVANANGEYVLTANMFNTLRNNLEIAGISEKVGLSKIPTGTSSGKIPHPVITGDTVYGHYFITLTDYMNSCIDKL